MNSDDLFRMIWNQIWQLSVLVILVTLLVRLAARRRPHLAYVLWLVVLAKCLTPPVMASPGGIFCWMQSPQPVPAATVETSDERSNLSNPGLSEAGASTSFLKLMTQSGTTVESFERVANLDSKTKARWNHAEPDDVATDVGQREPRERRLARHSDEANVASSVLSRWGLPVSFLWIGILWLTGSAALVVLASFRLAVCVRRFRQSAVDSHPALAALVVDLAGRLKVRRPVRLIVTASRIGPAVVGLWRPTIVLPTAVVQGKSPHELEPILAHELIHVRRGDLWISLWQVLAQAVWWFHPLVWLANRLTTRAAETCCDEEAIAALGCDPERYARSLLAVLEHKRGLISVPAFPGMRPVDVTRERLERIMQLGQRCRTRTPLWCWLVMGAVACVVLPGAALIGTAEEQSKITAENPPPNPGTGVTVLKAQEAHRKDAVTESEARQSAATEIVTVRIANNPQTLRPGQTIDLLLISLLPMAESKPDPRLTLINADSALGPPTFEQIVRAIPEERPAGSPFSTKVSRDNFQVLVELVGNRLEDSRFYPLVGQARHHIQHFKCTVRFDKIFRSDWPIPYALTVKAQEVIHIDKDQLISTDNAIGHAVRRDVMVETVQVDSLVPHGSANEASEICVAASAAQAKLLHAVIPTGRVVVFQRHIEDRESSRDRPSASADSVSAIEKNPESGHADIEAAASSVAPEPAAEWTAAMSFVLHTNSETKKVDQSLLANADEIRTKSEKIIRGGKLTDEGAPDGWASLSGNVQIWLQDGSMKATARTAVIETILQQYSAVRGKTLRIRLHRNVRWTSGELTASARKLTIVVEPLFPDDASGSRLSEMILEGDVELQGKEFEAQADTIGVHFDPAKDLPEQRSLRILMRGNARLSNKKIPGGAESHLQAAQIEFLPESGRVNADQAIGTPAAAPQIGGVPTRDSAASTRARDDRRRQYKRATSPSPNELITLTYSVADLVVPVEHMYFATSKDLAFIAASDEKKLGARTETPDEFAPRTEANFTDLMELISSTVSPESWVDQKGSGSMLTYRTTLSLVIRQTPAVHEEIADLLGQLRRLQDLTVELKLDVISTAGGASKNPLKFDTDPADSKEGASYLSESERKAFRKLVATSEGAAVMGGPTLVLQNGQGGELKLRRRLLSTGTSPLPALHVVPVIAADRSAVRLQLAVGASRPLDALARSHLYEVRKGHSLLIDVTDELAWNHISGPMGAQAALIRRQHKVAPAERVLLLITPQVVEVMEEPEGWLTDGPDVRR